jgi:hypothetical protein
VTLVITGESMSSDLTAAFAVYRPHAAADGRGAWVMSERPGRLLDRNQAITAMTIAELRATGGDETLIAALEAELA